MENEIKDSLSASDDLVSPKTSSLRNLLDQNEDIKEEVDRSAVKLNEVNNALKNNNADIPGLLKMEEVINQNEDAEEKVSKAGEDLHQVNIELAERVIEYIDIDSELSQMKKDLFEVRADLAKSQTKEKDSLHLALHDSLTGLPNRLLLQHHLDRGLTQARRHGWKLALMLIDLDKFKNINDSHGHDIGDKVLIAVAKRLQDFVRGEDVVCRWGGDEFVCVLLDIKLEDEVINLAKKMASRISEECNFDGTIVPVSATIGIAISPRDGDTADILFQQADRDMYNKKPKAKSKYLSTQI